MDKGYGGKVGGVEGAEDGLEGAWRGDGEEGAGII